MKIRSSLSALLLSLLPLLFMAITDRCLADTRVALVLGNGAYRNVPRLTNPANDAADVAAALKLLGFETIVATDLDRAGMDEVAIRFARAARGADVALLYYSGHALQFGGVNYLAPIDTQLTDVADLRRLVRLDDIIADLQQAKNLRVLVLDACRDNPFANELRRSLGASRAVPLQRGLAKLDNAQGMIVAYATQAGQTAEDGDGRNSPYTTAFLANIKAPEEIGTIFRRISSDVYESTKHSQLPELSLSIIGEFYLRGKVEVSSAPEQSGLSRTLLGTQFNADEVPFLCDQCRAQIKAAFAGKPLHSALVVAIDGGYYWSTARRTALEARANALALCLNANRQGCLVYAIDGRISWDEPPPPLPIEPWFSSSSGVARPLNIQDIGAIHASDRDKVARLYREFHGKALAVGPDWQWSLTGRADSDNEAARIALQRCGYITHSPCRVAAIADSLVVDRNLLDFVPRSIPARPLTQNVTGPDYALTGPQFRSSEIPFVCDQCREQIEQQLSAKPGHTALAISLSGGFWPTWGRGSAEEARTRVLGACLGASQTMCFVYAVDGKVVWKEAPLDVPPAPWFSHAGETPLAVADPIFSERARTYVEKFYSPASGPKAIAYGEGGFYGYGYGALLRSENEAARLALERCGFLVQATCRVIAINDSFVVDTDAIARQRH
ncbi:caspase family protein [Bradyrhizobium sp. UFLA05-112]